MLNVRAGQCRWPHGDPATEDFRFCGRETEHGPYCAFHTARAFSPRPVANGKPIHMPTSQRVAMGVGRCWVEE